MMLTCWRRQIHFLISENASGDAEELGDEPAFDLKRKLFKTKRKRI